MDTTQITAEVTSTSARVLGIMSLIPNGHFVGLHNPATGAVTFLGRAEITRNPALYDDAMTQGELAWCFWRMTNDGLQPNGNVGFTCHISVCPGFEKLNAELKEHVRAYCETTFGCIPTAKN